MGSWICVNFGNCSDCSFLRFFPKPHGVSCCSFMDNCWAESSRTPLCTSSELSLSFSVPFSPFQQCVRWNLSFSAFLSFRSLFSPPSESSGLCLGSSLLCCCVETASGGYLGAIVGFTLFVSCAACCLKTIILWS